MSNKRTNYSKKLKHFSTFWKFIIINTWSFLSIIAIFSYYNYKAFLLSEINATILIPSFFYRLKLNPHNYNSVQRVHIEKIIKEKYFLNFKIISSQVKKKLAYSTILIFVIVSLRLC